jgi:high-affinity iron transporter
MIEALVITLREGVEAALIIGITLAYLNKIGRSELRKYVYSGLVSAVIGSIVAAVLVSRLNLNTDIVEGWVMLVAAVFVISMVVFMMKTGRRMKGDIESRLSSLTSKSSHIGLFLFVFLMILREGVETVLILSAVSLNTTGLLNFLGTLIGIGLAVAFGVMFVRGTVKVNLQKFFKVTTVILFFVAFQLVVSGLHELSENGVLPSSKREMAMIGPIVRNDMFFFVTILALAAMMVLFEYRRRAGVVSAVANPAERRKAEWTARRERFWASSLYICSFVFIIMVTAQFIYAKSASALSPATLVTFSDGQAIIPLSQVADGHLHRYTATIDGTEVRFLLYQKPDGKIATVFDACEICGPVGFYETQQGLTCKNCAAPINPQSVGTAGGCNPVPLKSVTTNDGVVLTAADLQNGLHIFQKK